METHLVVEVLVGFRVAVGGVFLVAGAAKLVERNAAATVAATALADLVPPSLHVAFWRGLGAIELCIGLIALAGLRGAVSALVIASSLALVYVLWALRARPGRSCGCFGSKSVSRRVRSVLRTGVLLIFSISAAFARSSPDRFWTYPLAWFAAALALGVIIALSPDLRALLTRTRTRCPRGRSARRLALSQIARSSSWHAVASEVETDQRRTWQRGCVVFVAFETSVRRDGLVVAAVDLASAAPSVEIGLFDVRGALIARPDSSGAEPGWVFVS